jgi:hypothetical protein
MRCLADDSSGRRAGMRLTSRGVWWRGGDCDVIRRLTSGRNSVRGFPQVNIPPSSSLELHYSRSDRLLTSDPACGLHGNSPTNNRQGEVKGQRQCIRVILMVAQRAFISLFMLLSHTKEWKCCYWEIPTVENKMQTTFQMNTQVLLSVHLFVCPSHSTVGPSRWGSVRVPKTPINTFSK